MVLTLLEQGLKEVWYALGVVARASDVDDTLGVGLKLIEPAMFGEEGRSANLDCRLREAAVADAGETAHDRHAGVRLLSALHLLDRMPLYDMPDFVAQRSGQLVETIRALDETAVYVDVAARQRERVDLFRIDDVEVPVEVGPAGRLRDRLAEVLDVAANGGIGDDRKLRVDLLRVLAADCRLLVL